MFYTVIKIEIVIQNGGQDLIQISDNGIGMNKSDLQLAFMRHATSKINIKDDLNNIKSLGFRGEALPSIASISMFTAKSSTKNNDGYEIQIHGGELKNCKPSPSLKGTTCKVENIFYNVPARRKFLKSINSEQTAINKTLRRFMYSHPNISFKMYSNKKLVYDVPKHTLIERIHAILGANFKNNMLEVNLEKSNYIITGYICNLSLIKKRPGEQYIYLNGRGILVL